MQLGIVFLILTCMSSCIVTKAVDGGDDSSDDWTAVEKKTLELETKVAGLKTEICALEMKLKEENDEHQNQLKKMSANVSDTMKLVGVQTTDLATLRADVDTLLQELTAATPTPAPADIPACPDNWVEHNGQCLFFSSNTMTWFSAKMNCMYIDAHLAIVDNEDLNTFLKVRLRAPGGNTHFIGGFDFGQQSWMWDSSNTEIVYSDWGIGQPSNGRNDHCLVICVGDSCQWNDLDCHINRRYICQRPAVRKGMN